MITEINSLQSNYIQIDYPKYHAVSTTNPLVYSFMLPVSNQFSIPLYAQVSGTVTLASGSTASINFPTQNLGEIPPNTTAQENNFLCTFNITSYPTLSSATINEVETLNLTVSFYFDSSYTNFYYSDQGEIGISFFNSNSTSLSSIVLYGGTNSLSSVVYLGNVTASSMVYVTSNPSPIVTGGYSFEFSSSIFSNGGIEFVIPITPTIFYFLLETFVYPTTAESLSGWSIWQSQPSIYAVFSNQTNSWQIATNSGIYFGQPYFPLSESNTFQYTLSGGNFENNIPWGYVGYIILYYSSTVNFTYG